MLKTSFRTLGRIAIVTALVFALAGWAVSTQSVAAQEEGISGTLTNLGFGLGDEIATTRVERFQEMYPDVELSFTEGAMDPQQFLTSVASGNPPDLVYMARDVLSTYALRGAVQPLTDCIANHDIDMSQYYDVMVNQVTVDGVVYGIPEFNNNIVIIISNQALEDAGLTVDDVNTSDWEALTALNEQLTRFEGDELTRIGFDPKLPEFFPLWVKANGADLLSEDGRTAQLNSPEAVEALEFAYSLIEPAGGTADFLAFRGTWDFFGGENQVVSDQIGAWPMEQWYVNVLAGVSPDVAVSFKPFTDREGNVISFSTGSTWAIPTGAANPEAACVFMKTMTEADAWIAAAQARADIRAEEGTINTGVYGGNRVADETIFGEIVQPSGNEAFDNGVQVVLEAGNNGFAVAPNPAGNEFKQAWTDAVNRVLNGEQSVQDALDQAQQEAQAALDAAWSAE